MEFYIVTNKYTDTYIFEIKQHNDNYSFEIKLNK